MVFDRTIGMDDVPAGYQAAADRQALKVLIRPQPAGDIGSSPRAAQGHTSMRCDLGLLCTSSGQGLSDA
jgi:hypothetical protein